MRCRVRPAEPSSESTLLFELRLEASAFAAPASELAEVFMVEGYRRRARAAVD